MPRILNFTQDLEFANKWYTGLPGSGFEYTDTLLVKARLFAASNGQLYELQPGTGQVVKNATLLTVRDTTHIASDGKRVFGGVYGNVVAYSIDRWDKLAWRASMPGLTSWPVNLLTVNGRLFAGTNGFVVELDPNTGNKLNTVTVSQAYGAEVRMASDGTTLFVGSHGYAYGIKLNDVSKVAWTTAMTGASYSSVHVFFANGMLFAGSNGTVHWLDRNSGARSKSLVVSAAVDEEVHLALADQRMLVAGCHGYAYGIKLDGDWSKPTWTTPMAGSLYKMVDVVHHAGHIYAGSNGYMQRLDAVTGVRQNALQLSNKAGSGDYTPSLTLSPDLGLFVGMHGYVYSMLL